MNVPELIAAHNEYRKQKGEEPLLEDERLTAAAEGHANWMAEHHKMSHSQGWFGKGMGTRIHEAGFPGSRIGENIAWGQKDVETVMNVWIRSAGHRRNILGGYDRIGVARVGDYWCVDFGKLGEPTTGGEGGEEKTAEETGTEIQLQMSQDIVKVPVKRAVLWAHADKANYEYSAADEARGIPGASSVAREY